MVCRSLRQRQRKAQEQPACPQVPERREHRAKPESTEILESPEHRQEKQAEDPCLYALRF